MADQSAISPFLGGTLNRDSLNCNSLNHDFFGPLGCASCQCQRHCLVFDLTLDFDFQSLHYAQPDGPKKRG